MKQRAGWWNNLCRNANLSFSIRISYQWKCEPEFITASSESRDVRSPGLQDVTSIRFTSWDRILFNHSARHPFLLTANAIVFSGLFLMSVSCNLHYLSVTVSVLMWGTCCSLLPHIPPGSLFWRQDPFYPLCTRQELPFWGFGGVETRNWERLALSSSSPGSFQPRALKMIYYILLYILFRAYTGFKVSQRDKS